MSLTLLRFLAMTIGPSITAAARPATTLLAIQITVVALLYHDLAALPETLAWLASAPAIIVVAVLAGLETAAKHDPDVAAVLRDVQVDNVSGALGALGASLLFVALGMPESEAAALVADGSADHSGALDALALAAASEQHTSAQLAAVGGAVGINLGLTWLRSQLLELVDDFDLGKLWARLETGGVVGVLILLPLLPLVAFGFMVVSALALVAASMAARAATRAVDRRRRVACEACDFQVRIEASICPDCRSERQPAERPSSGLSAAYLALRSRSTDDP
jgi:hypothetical protein